MEDYITDITNKNNEYLRNIENAAFVNLLYKTLLSRQPDESGFKGWIGQLESGVSREKIIKDFLKSEEFINICSKYKIIAN